jgi:Spy/CpxP family protein refolding chaperone
MSPSTIAMKKLLPTSIMIASALLASAPTVANAAPDSTSAYLTSLNQHGVKYGDSSHIVAVGTTLCQELRNQLPSDEAVNRISRMGYSDQQAHVIAASAVLSFCPDMDNDAK